MEQMDILLVTETYLPYITGVASSTDSIARYMVSVGNKVTLISPESITNGVVEPLKGLKLIRSPSIPDPFYKGKATAIFPLTLFTIWKAMQRINFDVIHIQEPGSLGLSALILAKIHKIPTVGALHFIPEQVDRMVWGKLNLEKVLTPLINVFIRIVYNQYDSIMAPSHYFANYLKRVGVKKTIYVISNGVDTTKFHPVKKALTKFVTFLFLGRLDGDKNVGTLVRAMPYVNENVHLLVVGKGKDKDSLHLLARDLKVEDKTTWIDFISDIEMIDIYHTVDCFSIMSPFEGQSIVTLQAVASGLPLICARAGALPELCVEGKNAYLIDTYDYKTVAQKMNELADNKVLREKFGRASREISLSHHKPKVLHKLELLYKSLVYSNK